MSLFEIPELLEAVTDNLKDDLSSLLSCALVATKWTYPSRRYIFRTVRIRTEGNLIQFEALLESYPYLLSMVKCMHATFTESTIHQLLHFTHRLPSLNTLHVAAYTQNLLKIKDTEPKLPSNAVIEKVIIDRIKIDSWFSLARFLAAFPKLRCLVSTSPRSRVPWDKMTGSSCAITGSIHFV